MHKELTAVVFASFILFLALGSVNGLVSPRLAEVGVIILPALAVASMQPARCCNPFKARAA